MFGEGSGYIRAPGCYAAGLSTSFSKSKCFSNYAASSDANLRGTCYVKKSEDGKTIYWYPSQSDALNESGKIYYFLGIAY